MSSSLTMTRRQLDQQSRVFHDLSSLLLDMLRSPPSPIEILTDNLSPAIQHPSHLPAPAFTRRRERITPISPAGFASLMLGIAMALMFCGSITFFIGFMLMPWVLGLFMVLYFVGFVSTLSVLGRSILCYATSPMVKPSSFPAPSSPRKAVPAWKLL